MFSSHIQLLLYLCLATTRGSCYFMVSYYFMRSKYWWHLQGFMISPDHLSETSDNRAFAEFDWKGGSNSARHVYCVSFEFFLPQNKILRAFKVNSQTFILCAYIWEILERSSSVIESSKVENVRTDASVVGHQSQFPRSSTHHHPSLRPLPLILWHTPNQGWLLTVKRAKQEWRDILQLSAMRGSIVSQSDTTWCCVTHAVHKSDFDVDFILFFVLISQVGLNRLISQWYLTTLKHFGITIYFLQFADGITWKQIHEWSAQPTIEELEQKEALDRLKKKKNRKSC